MVLNIVQEYYSKIKQMKLRKIFIQGVSLAMIVGSALMVWKILMVITMCESPVVVVLSGSMEPAYHRGDILFLSWWDEKIVAGDVVVYKLKSQEIPIVHRVITVQDKNNGQDSYILTKGDNNPVDDRNLFDYRKIWLYEKDLMGRIDGYVPYVGYFTILLNDYPILKYMVLTIMSVLVLTAKDPQS